MWKIYKFTNKTYNEKEQCYKSYIGMTVNSIEERFKQHCYDDNLTIFHAAIVAYGKNNWTWEILEDNIKTEKEALEREEFYIEKHNTLAKHKKGYNVLQRSGGREIIDGKLKCHKCCKFKTLENFSKDKVQKCGYNAKCKSCCREYKLENKEHIKIYKKEYREIENKNAQKRDKITADKNSLLSIEELRSKTTMKYCPGCKTTEKTINFTRDKYNKDGFKLNCRKCCSQKDKRIKRPDLIMNNQAEPK